MRFVTVLIGFLYNVFPTNRQWLELLLDFLYAECPVLRRSIYTSQHPPFRTETIIRCAYGDGRNLVSVHIPVDVLLLLVPHPILVRRPPQVQQVIVNTGPPNHNVLPHWIVDKLLREYEHLHEGRGSLCILRVVDHLLEKQVVLVQITKIRANLRKIVVRVRDKGNLVVTARQRSYESAHILLFPRFCDQI